MTDFTIYHYTNRPGWRGINNGREGYSYIDPRTGKYVNSKDIRGLWPNRRLIPFGIESSLVPTEATEPHIFGLLEDIPSSWINYGGSMKVFEDLMHLCSRISDEDNRQYLVLLKVNLSSEDDPSVVDFSHIRRHQEECNTSNKISPDAWAQANKKYWDSRVSLSKYAGDYVLPEVIVPFQIPKERIQFVFCVNCFKRKNRFLF